MKLDEIRALSDAELRASIQDMKHESLNLRIQQQSGQLERPSRLRDIRRTIARARTVMRERQMKQASEAVQ